MNKRQIVILLIGFVLCQALSAKIHSPSKQMTSLKAKETKLSEKISLVDERIKKLYGKYSKIISRKNRSFVAVEGLKQSVKELTSQRRKLEAEYQKTALKFFLNSDRHDSKSRLISTTSWNQIKISLRNKIDALSKKIEGRNLSINDYVSSYEKSDSREQNIFAKIQTEEQLKQRLISQYETIRFQIEKISSKIRVIHQSRMAKIKKELGTSYISPVDEYDRYSYKNAGVTYYTKNRQPVKSPESGKVVYVGTLSTYGNLVMIDHGKEVRSVLLGDFSPKIKKDSFLKKGDVLGYTKIGQARGQLYFEIRKSNKAKPTGHLISNLKRK